MTHNTPRGPTYIYIPSQYDATEAKHERAQMHMQSIGKGTATIINHRKPYPTTSKQQQPQHTSGIKKTSLTNTKLGTAVTCSRWLSPTTHTRLRVTFVVIKDGKNSR